MPAANQEIYNKQIGDLAATGEEGILLLAGMIKAPGTGTNAAVEYALTGLADYVSGLKDEKARQIAIAAFQKAAAQTSVPETKAFMADRLRTLGVDYQPMPVSSIDYSKALPKNAAVNQRIAALQYQVQNSAKPTAAVLKALKDPSAEYRNAALLFSSGIASRDYYIELAKVLRKAKPEVQTDILNFFGRESKQKGKADIIRNLELRFDQPFRGVLMETLRSKSPEVREASAWAMVKIGDAAFIPALSDLLASSDQETVKLGQQALASFSGDITPAVVRTLSQATDGGKVAAIELLALRKASSYINNVLEMTKSSSPTVKQAAYAALKDVAAEKDLTLLCGMLETSSGETVKPLQLAVITALSSLPAKDRIETVNKRMIQAGESKKPLYYFVLAAINDKDALPVIINGFKSGNDKDAALDALIEWKGEEVAPYLYAIASDSKEGKYSARALGRYISIASDQSLFSPENRLLRLRSAMEIAKENDQRKNILRQIGRTGTYLALVYAGEFLDDKPVQQAAANAVMEIALAHPEYAGANVRALLNKVSAVLDNPDASYQRENIRKHLSEMPDITGFVSIFNGKDLTGWKGLVKNPIERAKMKADQLAKEQVKADERMVKDWVVENGLLVFNGTGYDNLCTEKQYADFEMYVDWMLDPSGKEADAGIYLRGTPQVQIWDTARVNVGAQVGSGGLYNNQKNVSKPLKVADNAMGEWNTFFIRMIGDRVTVYLNGELVTDNIILENYWNRALPIFPVEQIELQAHGSKVYYRNIYIKELQRPEPFTLSDAEKKEGYKILFDGTNMHEWTGNTVDYTLKDGTITLVPSHGSGGNLYTKDEYADFVFRFEFLLTDAANNGLGIRTPMEGDAAYVGMELQILDNEAPVYADLAAYQYHGSVYGIIPAKRGFLKPNGEWNTEEVIAKGDNIKITLNGEVILNGNIRDAVKNGTPDHKEHPGLFNKKGHIGFLGHGSEVKFRNIRVKTL
jgi:HEAT repeat protein